MDHLTGSLTLHATYKVEHLNLPSINSKHVVVGSHLEGLLNGSYWTEQLITHTSEVLIPARLHRLSVSTTNKDCLNELSMAFSTLDNTAPGARHLYKLNNLLNGMTGNFASVVNNKGNRGTISLLSKGTPVLLFLTFDSTSKSVQLMWSTNLDIINEIRNTYGIRYFFYRFPIIVDRPVFIHSHAICSNWWRWTKSFGKDSTALMLAANAAEVLLFKDPNQY